jgi:endonuclease IV
VTDKKNLASIHNPIQIMPSTTHTLSEKILEEYKQANKNNPDILIHINYICKIFSSSAVPENSLARLVIKQYKQLADSLNTKRLLFHLPSTANEMDNINIGFSILSEELDDYKIYLEMPSWTSLLRKMTNKETYFREIEKYYNPKNQQILLDTAHLFSNGYTNSEMINFFEKYPCDYCHLNGNKNSVGTTDSHVAIYSPNSKWIYYDEVCKYLANSKRICVVEMTKKEFDWKDWEDFAKQFKFNIVPFNKAYSI